MAKTDQLDKGKILELLARADTRWFNGRFGRFRYWEHLEFVAEYVAKNYHKKGVKHGKA